MKIGAALAADLGIPTQALDRPGTDVLLATDRGVARFRVVWFLRRGDPLPTYPPQALLVVDLTETGERLARIHRLIDEVNQCTGSETIRVRHGHTALGGQPQATRVPNLSGQNKRPGVPERCSVAVAESSSQSGESLAARR